MTDLNHPLTDPPNLTIPQLTLHMSITDYTCSRCSNTWTHFTLWMHSGKGFTNVTAKDLPHLYELSKISTNTEVTLCCFKCAPLHRAITGKNLIIGKGKPINKPTPQPSPPAETNLAKLMEF